MAASVEVKPLKKCRDCGLLAYTKSDLEQFTKAKREPHGRTTWCKKCTNIYENKRYGYIPPPYLRKCRDCGLTAWTTEDLELFVKSSKRPHGRATRCKKCRKKYAKEYHKKNPLKSRYTLMMCRCYYEKDIQYAIYGGRGITVCDEWRNSQQAFIDWAMSHGFKPELTLDRIDNDKGYYPNNCRWATIKQQAHNRRNNTTNWEKGTRICHVCKVEKPLEEFYPSKTATSGRRRDCKVCSTKAYRDWYQRTKKTRKGD